MLANRARMQRLAFYSRTRLHEITEHFAARIRPQRRLHGAAARREGPQAGAARPAGAARRRRRLSRRSTPTKRARSSRRINPDTEFAGAIHLPNDEVGNCRQFALLLKNEAQALRRELRVQQRRGPAGSGRAGARCRSGRLGDASAGAARASMRWSSAAASIRPRCCGRWACDIPLAPVYGYSISAPIREPLQRAAQRADGRALQGGDRAPGQPRARGGQRRDRRLAREKAAGRHPDAVQGAARLVPGRGATCQHRRRRAGMEGRAAHAARRAAADRRHRHSRASGSTWATAPAAGPCPAAAPAWWPT